MNTGTLIALIVASGGLLTGVGALIRSVLERPKVRAEAVSIISGAATEQINNLSTRLGTVEREVRNLHRWRHRVVNNWWPRHQRWDDQLEEELERVDPGAKHRLPLRPPFPDWESDSA